MHFFQDLIVDAIQNPLVDAECIIPPLDISHRTFPRLDGVKVVPKLLPSLGHLGRKKSARGVDQDSLQVFLNFCPTISCLYRISSYIFLNGDHLVVVVAVIVIQKNEEKEVNKRKKQNHDDNETETQEKKEK